MEVKPVVSIIIPTYKRHLLLTETLISVRCQSFTNWECIIIDDIGEKETQEVVEKFHKVDSRFRYYKRPKNIPEGACGARNFGFEMSKGKYIQWLDDDDLLSPNKLELQVEMLDKNQDVNVLVTSSWDMYWKGKDLVLRNILENRECVDAIGFFKKMYSHQSFIPSHAYLTPRELVTDAGPWNTELTINQDGEFFTRVILKAKKLCNTPNCNVLYRIHEGVRISAKYDSENLSSLITGYKLIHSHLAENGIKNTAFFRWKLLKMLLTFWEKEKEVIKRNKNFFEENNIKLSLVKYYFFKFRIYKIIIPRIKQIKRAVNI